jgi:ATP-dependent Clp protease protease subunit
MYFDESTREVFLYNDIGPAWAGMFDSEMMKFALTKLGKGDVNLRINSYGGSVDEALAMIEVLGRHDGKVKVTVDSIAASAASLFPVIFESSAAKHSRIMIHNPWGVSIGNAAEMRRIADVLDLYRDSIVTIYKQGMKQTEDEIKTLLDAETWYSADNALANGLVDEVTEPATKVAAKAAPQNRFKNVPQDLIDTKPVIEKPKQNAAMVAAQIAIRKHKLKK